MKLRSLRRVTNDTHHNAFTGACWFQGALYIAFRQGESHIDKKGTLVVLRSCDEGASFETVAALRGEFDTRDAHLRIDGDGRLFLTGFELEHFGGEVGAILHPGTAWTDNGKDWSHWTRFGASAGRNTVFWRPECFGGRHYCAAYTEIAGTSTPNPCSRVEWYESEDGIAWEHKRVLLEGPDQPNECSLAFHPDGTAILLARREHASRFPVLLRAAPPYDSWEQVELEVPLQGPALWFVGDDIWFSGRWFLNEQCAYVSVFRLIDDKPVMQMVLPSGPGWDCSYMGVARHPLNSRRFSLSYYSEHTAIDGSPVSQWGHPDIYLADVTFTAEFITDWSVSPLQTVMRLHTADEPDSAGIEAWTTFECSTHESGREGGDFVNAEQLTKGRSGVVYFVTDLDVGPCDSGLLHIGNDGPIRVWLNGRQVLEAPGLPPAAPDQHSFEVHLQHGMNRLAVALDTREGGTGIFARFEKRGA